MDIRTRIKKTLTVIPTSLVDASRFLAKIGARQKEIDEVKDELEEKINKLKKEASKKLSQITKERDTLTSALFAYAQAKRYVLTMRLKTVAVATGVFGWRYTPPAVYTLEEDEAVIARLKHMGLGKYVRVKEELDREKLLVDRPFIRGISYPQREEFFVVPKTVKEKRTITVAIDA